MAATGGRRVPSTHHDVTSEPEPNRAPPADRRALAWVAGGAVVALFWLAHPFGTALLLGALMAFSTQPAYARLARWTGRPRLVALGMVLASGLLIVGSAVAFATVFVSNAVALTNAVREGLRPGGALPGWVGGVSRWLKRF